MRDFFRVLATAALIVLTLAFILWWAGIPAWYHFTGNFGVNLLLNGAIWIAAFGLYGWIMKKIYAKHPAKAQH